MNQLTRRMLVKYVESKGVLTMSDIDKLFERYVSLEIRKYSDIFKNHDCFHDFIISNLYRFAPEDEKIAKSISFRKVSALRLINDERFYNSINKHQKNFAKEVEELVGFDKSVKILEVGSGSIPYSSIILGKDGYNITSMDEFALPKNTLQRLNVKSYRQLFNMKTNVKDFDIVVGRRPCSAIQPIVTVCSEQKVPYFLRLCGCEVSSGNIYEWHDRLSAIDNDIEYLEAYAYNLKGSNFKTPINIDHIVELDEDKSNC